MTPIRVALVDDHPIVLAGVKALLQSAPEIELVAEATTAAGGEEAISQTLPDLAVIDVSLPDLNGIELAKRLAVAAPKTRLIALTVHEDRAYVQPMLQAGVRGYLLKRSAADELIRAIRAVVAGGVYLDPAVAEKALADHLGAAPPPADAGHELSPRESEVLRLTAQGFSNKETASLLNISVKSVETYKARAAEKVGLRSRAEIVRFAARNGWLDQTGSSG